MTRLKYIVGIDEAGRGPLAGPVSVGVVAVPALFQFSIFQKLKDSKKLSEKRREEICLQLETLKKSGDIKFLVGLIGNEVIDKNGISYAIKSGIDGILKKLALDPGETKIFLDGALRAPSDFPQETIIKGDEKIPVISLASICAKVTRDRYMKKIASIYPEYGFDIHMGYGTKKHIEAIKKYGLSKLHRKTFCKNFF